MLNEEGLLHKAAEHSASSKAHQRGRQCCNTQGLAGVMADSCSAAALPPWRCCLAGVRGNAVVAQIWECCLSKVDLGIDLGIGLGQGASMAWQEGGEGQGEVHGAALGT